MYHNTHTHTHTHKYHNTHTHSHASSILVDFRPCLWVWSILQCTISLLHHVVKTSTVAEVNRGVAQQSELPQAHSAHCHLPLWPLDSRGNTNSCFFFVRTFFFLSQERKELGKERDPYRNREQKQKHTERAPVSQCFWNTFPKHWRKNPTLVPWCVFCCISLLFDTCSVLPTMCHGPLRECLRARRFRAQATLLLHTICGRSCCTWRASCLGQNTKKKVPIYVYSYSNQNTHTYLLSYYWPFMGVNGL